MRALKELRPALYDAADITAIQQLEQGVAGPDMQKRALKWIIETVAETYDQSYNPGDTHGTAFAEGRRFVGNSIVKMLKLEPGKVRRMENG